MLFLEDIMKPLFLLLSVLSASAFASTSNGLSAPDLEQQQKDLSNPELYKQHHIQIVKEEQHHFLFFPYTKQVLVNDIKLVGTDVTMASQQQTPYIQSVSRNEENQTVLKNDVITTGLFVHIKKLDNSNQQTITVDNSELVKLENFTTNLNNRETTSDQENNQTPDANDNEPMTIQLPTIKQSSFSEPIQKNHFEKTWQDSSGTKYKLIYTGEKNIAKS